MARPENRIPQNTAGEFFVDDACIDCDTCRGLAPALFGRTNDFQQSFVQRQPSSADEKLRALMALVACPTSAIGTMTKVDVAPAVAAFPTLIADDVYYCGFTSEASFGAASYLIRRPEGNVLVDSPRASRPLIARLREMGGVKTMFLTHRDDVADHEVFHRAFGCERILHRADMSSGTAEIERAIEGDRAVSLAPDLQAVPVPGHTAGSMALLYRDEFLFSGDHLSWSAGRGHLHASRCVNWFSWEAQVRSVERLLALRFRWVLPGHGRRFQARTHEEMHRELEQLVARLRDGQPNKRD